MPAQVTGRFTASREYGGQRAADREQDPGGREVHADLPGEAPAAWSLARNEEAQTPVLNPAVTTAAVAPMRSRLAAAARGPAGRRVGRGRSGGTRSTAGRP
jgi:hypothetical protein